MTFFEQEMRKLISYGIPFSDPVFAGRACYGRLDGDIRVRMEFAIEGSMDQYSALSVTLINRKEGPIDSVFLRLRDVLGDKRVANPNFPEGISPHIWKNGRDYAWYVYKPTPEDYRALADAVAGYTALFQGETAQEQGGDGAAGLRAIMSDGELRETQTANYFSNLYPIDCAVPSVNT